MELERITGSPTVPSNWPRRWPNGVPKVQETTAERHTELNAYPPYQRPTKWLPRSNQIFCRSCLPRWPQRSGATMHQSYHPNDFHREAVHRDPTECRIKRWPYLKCNLQSSFPRPEALLLPGEYDLPRCYRVRYGSMICHPRRMQLAFIVPPPNCNRNQEGIHVMVDYLTDFTLANSDDGLCLETTLWSESRTELRVKSQRSRLQCQIIIILLPSHDGNQQSIWWRRSRRSNQFSKVGDNHLYIIKS